MCFRIGQIYSKSLHQLLTLTQLVGAFGHCEAPCVKSRSQNWDPTSWKSRPKIFQVSVLETASVKIQAPKLRSQILRTMSWNYILQWRFRFWSGYHANSDGSDGWTRGPPQIQKESRGSKWSKCPNKHHSGRLFWRFPERTAVAVPVLVRLPRKDWRVGRTDARTTWIYI